MSDDDTDWLRRGREVLAQQPFSVLIGAELAQLERGICEIQLPLTAQLKQQNGFAHGGVLSYLADNALTYAAGTVLDFRVVTSEYKINYLRPAVGERLVARATAVHASKTQAVCRCDVFIVSEGEEKICAAAQGTIVRLPEVRPSV